MLDDSGMSVITVKKAELLETIKKNREEHRNIFLEAQKGFREQFISELDKMLADARAGKDFRLHVGLAVPQDHTKDYDRIIRMLEMSIADEVKITEQEFTQYVQDEWGWKRDFIGTSNNYTVTKR